MAPKVITVAEAAELVQDGATFTTSGIGGILLPERILEALEIRFLTTGHPRDLFWFDPTPPGAGPGFEHLSHEGLVKRAVNSWWTPYPELQRLILENKVEGYCFPLATGQFFIREMALGRPGYLTQVGLRSFVDPRVEGARLNSAAKEDLIELRQLNGEDWLWYRAFPVNVAFLRGTTADEEGNISLEEETMSLGMLYQALCVKRWKGIVIVQVKRLARAGSLHPRLVHLPGILVDYIVVDPKQAQNETFPDRFVEGLYGSPRVPVPPVTDMIKSSPIQAMWARFYPELAQAGPLEHLPFNPDKAVARRAALELKPGYIINVGAGIPMSALTLLSLEEDFQDLITISVEHGSLGGINNGTAWHINPTAIVDYSTLFSFYYGGGLDACFLAMIELDREGNVNLGRYENVIVGPGGAMDIAHGTRKVVFTGTFTAGGLKAQMGDGKLSILQEGKTPRLVERCQQVCFSAREMRRLGKEVLYLTERAVFRLGERGPVLTEVAPGIDVERDILQRMQFRPEIAPDLKTIDPRAYADRPMGLRRDILANG